VGTFQTRTDAYFTGFKLTTGVALVFWYAGSPIPIIVTFTSTTRYALSYANSSCEQIVAVKIARSALPVDLMVWTC